MNPEPRERKAGDPGRLQPPASSLQPELLIVDDEATLRALASAFSLAMNALRHPGMVYLLPRVPSGSGEAVRAHLEAAGFEARVEPHRGSPSTLVTVAVTWGRGTG